MSSGGSNKELAEVLSNLVDATKGVVSATEKIASERSLAIGERIDAIKAKTDSIPGKAMGAIDRAADALGVLNDKAAEALGYVKPTASTIMLGSWAGTLVQAAQAGVLGYTLGSLSGSARRAATLSELEKSPRLFLQVFRGLVKDPRFQHHPNIAYFAFVPSSQLKRTLLGLDGLGELATEFASTLQHLEVPVVSAEGTATSVRPRRVYGPNEEKQMLHDALELRRASGPDTLLLFYFYGIGGEVMPFSHPQLAILAELGNVALVGDVEAGQPSVTLPGALRVEFSDATTRVVEVDGLNCTIIGHGHPMHVLRRDGSEVCVNSLVPRFDDFRYLTSLKVLVYSYQKLWPSLTVETRRFVSNWFGANAASAWTRWVGFPGLTSALCHGFAEYWHWRAEPTRRRLYLLLARFGCMAAATWAVSKSRPFLGSLYGIICLVVPELGFHFPALALRHAPTLQMLAKKYFR